MAAGALSLPSHTKLGRAYQTGGPSRLSIAPLCIDSTQRARYRGIADKVCDIMCDSDVDDGIHY